MGKRLERITSDKFSTRLAGFVGQSLHVVLRDGHTYFGVLRKADNEKLELRDLRFHRHRFAQADILELILDR